MNDFHGGLYEQPIRDEPSMTLGGLPWLASAITSLRQQDPDLVLLDGGDLFQGSWPVNASQGLGSVEAYNLLGVTAAAVGNHEFDYGGGEDRRGALSAAAQKAEFAWLSANIAQGDKRFEAGDVKPFHLIETKGVRIGIIGLTTTDTPSTTTAANVADLTFHDPVETVRRYAAILNIARADLIVVVGHLSGKCAEPPAGPGLAPVTCTPDGEIGRLLTELPPGTIDIIAAGHAHTTIANRIGETFVFETRAEGTAIGRLDLVVGPDGTPDLGSAIVHPPWVLRHAPTDPRCEPGAYDQTPRDVGGVTLTPSVAALELVQKLEATAGSLCQEIGCAEAAFSRSREAESGAGDLVADLLLAGFPEADLAVQNSGGIRADLPAGKLRREHVQAVMPFQNRPLLIALSGAQVQRMLRIGSSGAHGLLQLAGARYRFDPKKTGGTDLDGDGAVAAWETDRLCWVEVGGKPLDPAATYQVAITDFLLGGGDHLGPAVEGATVLREGPLLRDLLITAIDDREACLSPLPDPKAARIEQGPCTTTP